MGQTILTVTQQKVLQTLAKDKIVTSQFYLTGGTALSEYYLQHRLSEDLDFFSEKEVDTLWLTSLSQKVKRAIVADEIDIQQSYNRNLVFFTVGEATLKTEFTYFPFSGIEKPLFYDGHHVDSILDIAVNKFFTIYQQPAARHFIDLYLILQKKLVKWEDLARLARIKFDVVIDPLQLGSQLVSAKTIGQLPYMLVDMDDAWRSYYIDRARELRSKVGR